MPADRGDHHLAPYPVACRLLLNCVSSFGRLDGLLISRGGAGVHVLSPRQLCNVMFSLLWDMCQGEEERENLMWELTAPMDQEERENLAWSKRTA